MARATTSSSSHDEPSVSDLAKQIETLQKDLGDLTSLMKDMGEAQAARLSEQAEAKVKELRDKGKHAAHAARDQAEDMHAQANAYIREQPATALGIAAGLGFLVGLLISRR
jgi:ElaB/YqjD/DUF883 family membrane-anchored ribosome-binding protein